MVTLRQQPDPSRGTDHPRPQPQRGGAARIPGGGVVTAEAEPADRFGAGNFRLIFQFNFLCGYLNFRACDANFLLQETSRRLHKHIVHCSFLPFVAAAQEQPCDP